jgi:purine-binding chemotaxis protein CheW
MNIAINMPATRIGAMNVVIELDGELYAVLVDNVGEVLSLPATAVEPLPPTLGAGWRALSHGIVRLDDRLLLLLAPDRMLAAAAVECAPHEVAA